MSKMIHLNTNAPIPTRVQYGGWQVSNGEQLRPEPITEAEAFKLLGDAIDHHEAMGRAIETLKMKLGVSK